MLKTNLLHLFLVVSPLLSMAQTDKQYEQLAEATCACASKKDLKGMNKNEASMELGMCMLSALQVLPEKDRKHFDFTDPAKAKGLGEKIGMKMAVLCPKTILAVAAATLADGDAAGSSSAADVSPNQELVPPPPPPVSVEGKVKEVIEGDLVTIILVETNGREHKLIWEKHFAGDEPFVANPQNLKNKEVTVGYYMSDRYVPKMHEYFSLKHIAHLTVK